MEVLNVAVQLSGSSMVAFHGWAILRCAEWWSRSVVVITSVDVVLVVDEQSRQRISQMTCTRWNTTMFAETVVLICFSYFDSFTLVGDNQKRVDDELTAEEKSRRHNAVAASDELRRHGRTMMSYSHADPENKKNASASLRNVETWRIN